MTRAKFQVVTTRGGARAMHDLQTGEVMHPVVGPRFEAEALYLLPSMLSERLKVQTALPLVLFDVGLGAGSNAIAAVACSESRPAPCRPLQIISFDRTTDALQLALEDANAPHFGLVGEARSAAQALLKEGRFQSPKTRWRMVLGELPATLLGLVEKAHIVFWDPFSPGANPKLWSVEAFSALHRACDPRATVHTYSAATATRSALLLSGFAAGEGAASGTKAQTTIAAMRAEDLAAPLGARWLERLSRSSAPFPQDAPQDAMAKIQRSAQFQTE